jgi:hypothetical protein
MPALPVDFLTTLIAEAAELQGVLDSSGAAKTTHPVMTLSAKLAYAQLCSTKATRRPFHYGLRTEYYDTYTEPLLLRTTPIDTTKPIRIVVAGIESAPDAYSISRNYLMLGGSVGGTSDVLYESIDVIAYSGIKTLEENMVLYNAVLLQTLATFHRIPTLGLLSIQGENGVRTVSSNSGEIIDAVKPMIADLEYMGIGYGIDGD